MSQGWKKNVARPGHKPRVSRLPCEHSTTELPNHTIDQFLIRFVPESARNHAGTYETVSFRFHKFNKRPSRATANPVGGEAYSSTKGGLLRYILNTYSIHKVSSFEICILQALNMPLIRCTNVFFQGRLPHHITSPSEKTRPETWPGSYMGKLTPFWQLSLSHRCHQT